MASSSVAVQKYNLYEKMLFVAAAVIMVASLWWAVFDDSLDRSAVACMANVKQVQSQLIFPCDGKVYRRAIKVFRARNPDMNLADGEIFTGYLVTIRN